MVIREQVREGRDSVGRKLIDVPGYTFRVFVTSCSDPPPEIWRGYNRRADMENRIAELKHDLGADGFCMKQFFATEAAFRAVDPRQIEVVSVEARKANDLIDRRTFSWTELFNRLETTLPDEVRITAVRPKVDASGTTLTISVIARAVDDVSQFMDNLQKTGAFRAVGSRIEEHMNEQNQLEAVFEAIYLPLAGGRGEK